MLNGNMEEAEGFFEDPLGRKLPNLVSYTLRIQGCCKKNQVDEANMILLEMEELGCAPNASCYGPIITGLSRLGRLQESFRLFEKMVIRGIHSSVISGNLMKRLCEVKMVNEILKLGKYIIAKKLAIQVSSITFLIENGSAQDGSKDGSKDLSQLLHDLRESDCLVPRA
jgi:leucine-rich PPR motif-containing protein